MNWLKKSLPVIFFFVFSEADAQLFNSKLNQWDKNGNKTGKWITWWDKDNKIPMSVAQFKNGRETGVSKEYHQNGIIRLKMRFYKSRVRVKYYNTNRKLEQKGWAILDYNKEDIHYYWHGKWKFYDENRKLDQFAVYQKGEEIRRHIRR